MKGAVWWFGQVEIVELAAFGIILCSSGFCYKDSFLQPAQRAQLSFRKRNETSHVVGRPLVALFGRNNEVLWMWRCTEERRPKAQRFNGESGEVNFDKGDDQIS